MPPIWEIKLAWGASAPKGSTEIVKKKFYTLQLRAEQARYCENSTFGCGEYA